MIQREIKRTKRFIGAKEYSIIMAYFEIKEREREKEIESLR